MLDEKVIVIIGGTTGIGRAASAAFLAAGAQVVAVGRTEAEAKAIQAELGARLYAFAGDARAPETAPRAIAEAMARFGRMDGLYHVAGGSGRRAGDGPLHELTPEGWAYTLDLNLTSVMLSNQAAVRHFLANKQTGSILNTGSVLAYSPSPTYFTTHAYAAAKAALIGFSRAIAASYAPAGIRVNVLAPGLIETPMAQRAAQDPTIQAFVRTKQPLDGGRIGQPEDLTGLATYFMSDASRFTTGQVIAIDGGWTVSEGQIPPES
ncbi:MAG: SDR family oxidoreductase [Bacteroidetes bacterium]|nr:MAG: SDR family oxidoreductase [Bacteroidota bacterium]